MVLAKTQQDFEMWEGEDIRINIKNVENIQDVNSLQSIKWKLLEQPSSPDPLIEKSVDNGISVVDDMIIIIVDGDDTEGLGGGRYYHEIRIVDGDDDVVTITTGTVKINESGFVTI